MSSEYTRFKNLIEPIVTVYLKDKEYFRSFYGKGDIIGELVYGISKFDYYYSKVKDSPCSMRLALSNSVSLELPIDPRVFYYDFST